MYRLTFDDLRRLVSWRRPYRMRFNHVVARIMQKDRIRRYQSLKEVQFDLEPIRIDLQWTGRRAAPEARELFDKQHYDAYTETRTRDPCLGLPTGRGRKLWRSASQRRRLQPGESSTVFAPPGWKARLKDLVVPEFC